LSLPQKALAFKVNANNAIVKIFFIVISPFSTLSFKDFCINSSLSIYLGIFKNPMQNKVLKKLSWKKLNFANHSYSYKGLVITIIVIITPRHIVITPKGIGI
jgi:hypothetical protein